MAAGSMGEQEEGGKTDGKDEKAETITAQVERLLDERREGWQGFRLIVERS